MHVAFATIQETPHADALFLPAVYSAAGHLASHIEPRPWITFPFAMNPSSRPNNTLECTHSAYSASPFCYTPCHASPQASDMTSSSASSPTTDVVELDSLVVLKIIQHCQEALPAFVTGQLLGLDIGRTLEVTNCFPFPRKDEGEQRGDDEPDDDGAEYQMEMMRCLREVNVDNNTVGWYQSTYFSSFIDESCIETQFNYQENIKNCVVLIYDPSRTRAAGLALRAFRLTEMFMSLYKDGKISFESLSGASRSNGAGTT